MTQARQTSIDGALEDVQEGQGLLARLSQMTLDLTSDMVFSQTYPLESGRHYDVLGRRVKAELIIRKANGNIEFAAWIRYADTNKPVLKEVKTRSGKPVSGRLDAPVLYNPEAEEITDPRYKAEEVNFSQYRNLDFSCKGLRALAETSGIDIGSLDEYNSLISKSEEIRQEISRYWRDNKRLPKNVKAKATKPMWEEKDKLELRANTVYAEPALKAAGVQWISTFPGKLQVFIENDGRDPNQGPYLQNWMRIADTPRPFYGRF